LPFCPEFEYYHQNGNFDPQHLTKLIDVTHVLDFDIMGKQKFFALMFSYFLLRMIKPILQQCSNLKRAAVMNGDWLCNNISIAFVVVVMLLAESMIKT